ncbi:MAG: ABC transporter permease, partial [Planctomycetota bacterium]|nr:ABC transporter permease [Planctomycetota bacterium]
MNLFTIALKSLRQRALASSLTALSVALGVMLIVAVLLIAGVVNEAFNRRSVSYDFIVGPKGSDMQLVLSTVYRIEPPIQNLPYLYYLELKDHPMVEDAVPLAFGDFTEQGAFPIVGTTEQYFLWGSDLNTPYSLVAPGKQMSSPFHAILGSEVARKNGWNVGSKFKLVHGGADTGHVHDEEFTVTGVLAKTGTPDDRTAFVNLEGFYLVSGHEKPANEAINSWRDFNGLNAVSGAELEAELKRYGVEAEAAHDHGHDHAHHGHSHDVPDVMKEVTAILVRMPKDLPTAGVMFQENLRRGYSPVQAVNPIKPMARLQQQFVGNIRNALLALTAVILVVSGVSIFVSIYNSMSERLREIAIMRALGARRETVFGVILAESLLLCLGGGLLGALVGHLLIVAMAPLISSRTELLIDPFAFDPQELWLIPALIVLA